MKHWGFKKAMSVVFCGLTFLGGTSLTLTIYKINQQTSDGAVINIAGRQRMLTQKMTKEVLLLMKDSNNSVLKESFGKTVQLFHETLKDLEKGNSKKGIPVASTDAVKNQLTKINDLWKQFPYYGKPVTFEADALSKMDVFLEAKNASLLKESNELVKLLEASSKEKISSLLWLLWFLMGVFSLVVISAAVLLNRRLMEIHSISHEIGDLSHSTESTSNEMATSSKVISDSSHEQSKSLGSAAVVIDQFTRVAESGFEIVNDLGGSIQKTIDTSKKGRDFSSKLISTVSELENSQEFVDTELQKTHSEMDEIVDAIGEISAKSQIINDIVFQTRLLSFNASVEAARAGEQGKGFSVVADEIGKLANISGHAANEIQGLVESSAQRAREIAGSSKEQIAEIMASCNERIKTGVEIALHSEQEFANLDKQVREMQSIVDKVIASSKEQNDGIRELNHAINSITVAAKNNSEVAAKNDVCSTTIRSQADQLDRLSVNLKKIVSGAA